LRPEKRRKTPLPEQFELTLARLWRRQNQRLAVKTVNTPV
jgi:hypothetical protein